MTLILFGFCDSGSGSLHLNWEWQNNRTDTTHLRIINSNTQSQQAAGQVDEA